MTIHRQITGSRKYISVLFHFKSENRQLSQTTLEPNLCRADLDILATNENFENAISFGLVCPLMKTAAYFGDKLSQTFEAGVSHRTCTGKEGETSP